MTYISETLNILIPRPKAPLRACAFVKKHVEKQFPFYIQPKIDGIRMLVVDGVGLSRSLKPIRNEYIQSRIQKLGNQLDGFDGELIVGGGTDSDVYNNTSSGVMSGDGEPSFYYHIFDIWNIQNMSFVDRYKEINKRISALNKPEWIEVSDTKICNSLEEIDKQSKIYMDMGWEGAMIRRASSLYKFGDATASQGQLIKIKNFVDTEAKVISFYPKLKNNNPKKKNELGRSSRSSHKDNKEALDTLGGMVVEGVLPDGRAYTCKIGIGWKAKGGKEIWDNRKSLVGKLAKFKYSEVGLKDKPRFPVFIGWRDEDDL